MKPLKEISHPKARLLLFAVLFACTFVFIRVYSATPVFTFCTSGDDSGYFAYTDAIFRTQSLNWCDPRTTVPDFRGVCAAYQKSKENPRPYNMYTPGPALTLMPFTLLGHVLDSLHVFRPARVDPLLFWSFLGTLLLFTFGVLMLFESSVLILGNVTNAFWLTLFFSIGNCVMFYIYRRPLMSHATEFFWFFASFYGLLLAQRAKNPLPYTLAVGVSAGMMLATRINNIHIPGVLFTLLVFWPGTAWKKDRLRKVVGFLLGAIPPLFVFLWFNYLQKGSFVYKTVNYDPSYTIGFFLKFYWVNLWRITEWFVGLHWGLIWMMPFFCYELYFFFAHRKKLLSGWHGSYRLPIVLIGVIFLVHLNMMANGPTQMSYAYRYVFTHYYFIHLGFLLALAYCVPRFRMDRRILAIGIVGMVVSSFHLTNFETNSTTLTMNLMPAREEGVWHPHWTNTTTWAAPYYAVHSFEKMATGKTLLNLSASPLFAYPVNSLAHTRLATLPGISKSLAYYQSEYKKIFGLSDLLLTFEYQLAYLLSLLGLFFLWRRIPERSKSAR